MFSKCALPHTRFFSCSLQDCAFQPSDWTGATFFQTPLAALDLRAVQLDGLSADLESLRGAQVTRSQAADLAHLFGLRIAPD